MKLTRQSVIATVVLLLIMLLATSMTYASGVYGQLAFKAENVYYEGNTLVVHGYWHNQTNKYIDYTNWVNMKVYTWNGSYWETIAAGNFSGGSLHFSPGQVRPWTYRIYHAPIKSLDRVRVQVNVNYHYQD